MRRRTLISTIIVLTLSMMLCACDDNKRHRSRNKNKPEPRHEYTIEDVENRIGTDKFYERDNDTNISYRVNDSENEYHGVSFVIYDDASEAERVYREHVDSSFYQITDEGDNYITGWLDGVCDAEVEEIYVLADNMVIYAEITVVDCWAESEDDPVGDVYRHYSDELIESLKHDW